MKKHVAASIAAVLCLLCTAAMADNTEVRGRSLLNELGCKACHRFDGQGGDSAPALDNVGERLSEKQIRRQLIAPREINPESSMPSYDYLDDRMIGALVDFLARQK